IASALCRTRGIAVCDGEGGFDVAVAEYVVAAALVLLRGLFVAEGGGGGGGGGRCLFGATFALLGFDRTARGVAYAARGLGARVVAHDPGLRPGSASWRDVEPVTRDALLARADVLSLHPPGGERGPACRLDGGDLARLRPDAVLVDASPGGAVDEAALFQALDRGRLRAAALDRPGPERAGLLRTAGRARRTAGDGPRLAALVARRLRAVLDRPGG
ncbi:MAG: hypothetical protein KDG89_18390, partial [Geminicoccaceae bacterium]|nr:hypothetical protein [Geminicoccaceae bacterium]